MQQFITGVQQCFSQDELEELLKFDIIPTHLLDEANAIPSLQSSTTNLRSANDFGANDLVTDSQLNEIANQAILKNWTKLALALGFLESDIEAFKAKNNNDSAAAVSVIEFFQRIMKTCFHSYLNYFKSGRNKKVHRLQKNNSNVV